MSILRKIQFYFIIFYNMAMAVSPYISLENRELYSLIEYNIIKNRNSTSQFILNQPYTFDEVESIFLEEPLLLNYTDYNSYYSNDSLLINIQPALNFLDKGKNGSTYASVDFNGTIIINNIVFRNEVEIDQKLKWDSTFHGQTKKWFMGHLPSSYVLFKGNTIEVFGGKVSRNMGPLNDYSLIFSNNPYSFHHYGFSAKNYRMQYSFFTSRLNDMQVFESIDQEPLNILYKRYWAYQKFDLQISPSIQISLSEAVIYGGEYQNIVFSLVNPAYFFYATQENETITSNDVWDIQLAYLPRSNLGIYMDIFADDFIINNEPGVDARSMHPDRLGLLLKLSMVMNKQLLSLRYVRIWNETYTSQQLYENYISNYRGIGFPYTSYESIKYTHAMIHKIPIFIEGFVEIWSKGDKRLDSYFDLNNTNSFPTAPEINGISSGLYISMSKRRIKYEGEFFIKHIPEYLNTATSDEVLIDIKIGVHYNINKIF